MTRQVLHTPEDFAIFERQWKTVFGLTVLQRRFLDAATDSWLMLSLSRLSGLPPATRLTLLELQALKS